MSMQSFDQFLLLEKLNKNVLSDAFNDPNFLVGIEFEMVFDFNKNGVPHEDYSNWANRFNKKVSYLLKESMKRYEPFVFSVMLKMLDEINRNMTEADKKRHLNKKIEAQLKKVFKIGDFVRWPNYNVNSLFEIAEQHINMSKFKPKIQEVRIKSWLKREIAADTEWNDLFVKKEAIVNYLATVKKKHWPSPQKFINVIIDGIIETMAETQADDGAIAYIERLLGIPLFGVNTTGEINPAENKKWVRTILQKTNPPFDIEKAHIGDYHSASSKSKNWRVETDSSLPEGGIEIISPPLPIKEAVVTIKKMFAWMEATGSQTTNATGLHINLSYKGKKTSDIDFLKVALFIDEGGIYKMFESRRNNTYAAAFFPYFTKKMENISALVVNKLNRDNVFMQDIVDFIHKRIKAPEFKYSAINSTNSERIEFRYLGGPNYHKKYNEVISNVGKFAAILKIGFDDNLFHKEYMKKLLKLQRVANANYKERTTEKSSIVLTRNLLRNIMKKPAIFTKDGIELYAYKDSFVAVKKLKKGIIKAVYGEVLRNAAEPEFKNYIDFLNKKVASGETKLDYVATVFSI